MKPFTRLTAVAAIAVMSVVTGGGGVALAQTATFDGFNEGAIGTDFVDAGIRFFQYNNRLDPPPSTMVAEWATSDLDGQPEFTAPNALGFGGYAPGEGAAYSRFGSLEVEPTSGTANLAIVNVYDRFFSNSGLTLTMEASLNGNIVATDEITFGSGSEVRHSVLSIEGVEFDHLFLYAGPNDTDAVFILMDTITVTTAGLTLAEPVPGNAGVNNTLSVTGATAGERVYFVYGLRSGSTAVPGCPGVTVDIASPNIAGSDIADANGEAELTAFVPGGASGREVLIQAVEQSTCTVSNLVAFTFN